VETLHDITVDNMNALKELRKLLNDSSMTMREYSKVKNTLNLLSNLSSDMVSLSLTLKEGEVK